MCARGSISTIDPDHAVHQPPAPDPEPFPEPTTGAEACLALKHLSLDVLSQALDELAYTPRESMKRLVEIARDKENSPADRMSADKAIRNYIKENAAMSGRITAGSVKRTITADGTGRKFSITEEIREITSQINNNVSRMLASPPQEARHEAIECPEDDPENLNRLPSPSPSMTPTPAPQSESCPPLSSSPEP